MSFDRDTKIMLGIGIGGILLIFGIFFGFVCMINATTRTPAECRQYCHNSGLKVRSTVQGCDCGDPCDQSNVGEE